MQQPRHSFDLLGLPHAIAGFDNSSAILAARAPRLEAQPALSLLERAVDPQRSGIDIEIFETQREEFAASRAGCKRQGDDGATWSPPPVAQRALDLILIKDPDLLPLVNARWLHGGFDVRLDGAHVAACPSARCKSR